MPKARSKRKNMASAAKKRERSKRKSKEKAQAVITTPTVPLTDFPADTSQWKSEHFVTYFKHEPKISPQMDEAGYTKERAPNGTWYFRSPGSIGKAGRVFIPGSVRLKTKSIPRHINAPANALQEPPYKRSRTTPHPPSMRSLGSKKVYV